MKKSVTQKKDVSKEPPMFIDLTLEDDDETVNSSTCGDISDVKTFDGANFLEDIKKQWEDQKYCDVDLVTSSGDILGAHKIILITKNSVFSEMFENLPRGVKSVDIPHIKFKILKEIIRYLYSDKIDIKIKLDVQTVGKLLVASERFKISGLQKFCKDFLIENLKTTENANYISHLGEELNLDDLKTAAKEFIDRFIDMTQDIQSKYKNS